MTQTLHGFVTRHVRICFGCRRSEVWLLEQAQYAVEELGRMAFKWKSSMETRPRRPDTLESVSIRQAYPRDSAEPVTSLDDPLCRAPEPHCRGLVQTAVLGPVLRAALPGNKDSAHPAEPTTITCPCFSYVPN